MIINYNTHKIIVNIFLRCGERPMSEKLLKLMQLKSRMGLPFAYAALHNIYINMYTPATLILLTEKFFGINNIK
jgi:hypothetical protein